MSNGNVLVASGKMRRERREKDDRGKEIRYSLNNVSRFTEYAMLNAHMQSCSQTPLIHNKKGLVTTECFLGCAKNQQS